MVDTLKVNVTLNFEVPIEIHEDGTRKSAIGLITPYLEDYIWDLQYNLESRGGKIGTTVEFPYSEYTHMTEKFLGMDLTERQCIDNNMKESYSARDGVPYSKWLDSKEEECKELYDMSSREFYRLSWKDRDAIRVEKNIKWDQTSNKWQKGLNEI